MRFLNDAFKSRPECIESFRDDLSYYIMNIVDSEKNVFSLKIAVESLGLLNLNTINMGLVKLLELGNAWINETAIKSYRYMPQLAQSLEKQLIYYFSNLSGYEVISKRKQYRFSLSLSDGFREIYKFYQARLFDVVIYYGLFALCSLMFPFLFLGVMFFSLFNFRYALDKSNNLLNFVSMVLMRLG